MRQPDFHYHGPVVVFDIDDTLIREREFCRAGFRHVADRIRQLCGDSPDYLYDAMDKALTARDNPFSAMERKLAEAGIQLPADWDTRRIVADYREHCPERIECAEGITELLEILSAAGIHCCIISDGRSITQRNKLKSANLERFFHPDDIYISEEKGCDKQSADSFRAIVRQYPEASRFIYVGDNVEKDFFHPNILGWISVMTVPDADNVHPAAEPASEFHAPRFRLTNVNQLLDICQITR